MAKTPKIQNDNISDLLGGIDPKYYDQDDFLDIVQWNLRWFNSLDKSREMAIREVLKVLNSDIFVFQEIEDKSLDSIASYLTEQGVGNYRTAYGTTGGQQRIALMWDIEWVRTKDDIRELFGRNQVLTASGTDVFPRLPLWSYFYCKSTKSNKRGFDFQLVGLHLKSQMDRSGKGEAQAQRLKSAESLSGWLENDAVKVDADTIMLGDWNEDPMAAAWQSFRDLERKKKALFSNINDSTHFSHLYYKNRSDVGSLLDLKVVTSPFATALNKVGGAIHWINLDELLESNASAKKVKEYINTVRTEVTDHLPVLTRFTLNKRAK
ncbi:MAG TPA: endonuclease/exonuclease/phosphatase family protein [Bacteroidales bacterium]|nr:endonuclease/exonuclease/phosphatase family protein [Bacteroidales bacterium]